MTHSGVICESSGSTQDYTNVVLWEIEDNE